MAGQHHGTDQNATALGASYKRWTINELQTVLDHYGVLHGDGVPKNVLMNWVNGLAKSRGLTLEISATILVGHKARTVSSRKRNTHSPVDADGDYGMAVVEDTEDQDMGAGQNGAELDDFEVSREIDEPSAATATPRDAALLHVPATVPLSSSDTSEQSQDDANSLDRSRAETAESASSAAPASTASDIFDCIVCYDSHNTSDIGRQPTSSCGHNANVCGGCLAQHIAIEFKGKTWDRITCPSCDERLNYDDVEKFADPQVFQRSETIPFTR